MAKLKCLCGAAVTDSAAFCSACGTRLPTLAELGQSQPLEKTVEQMKGTENSPSPIDAKTSSAGLTKGQSDARKAWLVFSALLCAILAMAGGLVGYWYTAQYEKTMAPFVRAEDKREEAVRSVKLEIAELNAKFGPSARVLEGLLEHETDLGLQLETAKNQVSRLKAELEK